MENVAPVMILVYSHLSEKPHIIWLGSHLLGVGVGRGGEGEGVEGG